MGDVPKKNVPSYERGVRKERTPRVEEGQPGVAHDGTIIPVEEMVVHVTEGADPEALARFSAQKAGRDALLAQLAGIQHQDTRHRPTEMTRGDIHPDEWEQLDAFYQRLKRLIDQKIMFSALAFSTYQLLDGLVVHGWISTRGTLSGIMPAYGYGVDTVKEFDLAVGIVWSMAQRDYVTDLDIATAIQRLITEIEGHEDHFSTD